MESFFWPEKRRDVLLLEALALGEEHRVELVVLRQQPRVLALQALGGAATASCFLALSASASPNTNSSGPNRRSASGRPSRATIGIGASESAATVLAAEVRNFLEKCNSEIKDG